MRNSILEYNDLIAEYGSAELIGDKIDVNTYLYKTSNNKCNSDSLKAIVYSYDLLPSKASLYDLFVLSDGIDEIKLNNDLIIY